MVLTKMSNRVFCVHENSKSQPIIANHDRLKAALSRKEMNVSSV